MNAKSPKEKALVEGEAEAEKLADASTVEPSPPKQEIIERLERYIQPGRENEAARVVQSMLVQQSHSGPLPPAREFRIYESVLPGAADRIIAMAEREQVHRQGLETKVVGEDLSIKRSGQLLSLFALFMMLAVVTIFAYLGHPGAGATLGTGVIVAVIAIFHGQKWLPKDKAAKAQDNADA